MRVTSEFWVQAYLRRVNAAGAFAGLRRRGAQEAGAIFIIIDHLDGFCDLFGPAPQTVLSDEEGEGAAVDRCFEALSRRVSSDEIGEKLMREARFDADLWVIEVEDREGRSFL